MLELRDVAFEVDGKLLLDVERIAVQPGKVTALLGPNGAGKTTALKLLTGDLSPTRGMAVLDGKAPSDHTAAGLASVRAVVTQSASLNFDFLVWEVVALGRMPLAATSSAAKDHRAISEALRLVGGLELAERRYLTLSGGEKQRVQFARGLAQVMDLSESSGAKYLLLDEPTSALDLKYQIDCLEVAQAFARQGNGVAIILHDLNLAAAFADDVYLLKDGHVVAQGPADDTLTPDAIRHAYDLTPERVDFALSVGTRNNARSRLPLAQLQAAE